MSKVGLFLAAALLLTLTAFGVSAQEGGMAYVQVAHLSPDTPNVDIYANGEVALSDVPFGTVSDWLAVPPGSYDVAVVSTGLFVEAAFLEATLELAADTYYTVAAHGSRLGSTLTASVLVNDLSNIGENEARIGVFHAIEGALPVDVVASGATIVEYLAYPGSLGSNDGFFEVDVPAGTYDVTVEQSLLLRGQSTAEAPAADATPEARPEVPVVLGAEGVAVVGGAYYFVAAAGTPDAPQLVVATTADDAAMAEGTPEAGAADTSTLTIAEIAAGNEDFSTLMMAVGVADPAVAEALSNPDAELTVFAPTNDAFAALLEQLGMSPVDLASQGELVTQVLLYHVVEGAVLAEQVVELDGTEVTTLQGEAITVSVVDGGVVLNETVNVVMTDIIAANGVIHVIDAVLVPPSVLESLGG